MFKIATEHFLKDLSGVGLHALADWLEERGRPSANWRALAALPAEARRRMGRLKTLWAAGRQAGRGLLETYARSGRFWGNESLAAVCDEHGLYSRRLGPLTTAPDYLDRQLRELWAGLRPGPPACVAGLSPAGSLVLEGGRTALVCPELLGLVLRLWPEAALSVEDRPHPNVVAWLGEAVAVVAGKTA